MKVKKPDIFLGITMAMLVVAALLCLAILFFQKTGKTFGSGDETLSTVDPFVPAESTEPADTSPADTSPADTEPNVEPGAPVDSTELKKVLDDALDGLSSEWQVMVIDPDNDIRVSSAVNCDVDDWMTANNLVRIFILGAAYQQVEDGTLTEDQVKNDALAMIVSNDGEAADRLTELIGGGEAGVGREAVKKFATSVGCKLGFNRALSGSGSQKNYVTAQQVALLLNLICRGECVSADASAKMKEILCTPNDNPAINLELSDGATGGFIFDIEDGTCICGAGIVTTAGRSYAVSVVCNMPITTDGAKAKVKQIIQLTQPFFK